MTKERPKRSAASKPLKDASSEDEEDNKNDNESEDDEPLAKKAKPSPPTVCSVVFHNDYCIIRSIVLLLVH